MSNILYILPKDNTTKFSEKTIRRLRNSLRNSSDYFKIHLNDQSHKSCLGKIEESEYNLIIFIGHGKSDCLFGAVGSKFRESGGSDFPQEAIENVPAYFGNVDFINKDNIGVFNKKKVICLTCRSNEKLGDWAIEKGCQTFIGFGDIPTDWIEDEHMKLRISKITIYQFRKIVMTIFYQSIIYSIENQFNFLQFEKIFKIITNKKIIELIHLGYESNDWVIQNLYKLKDEIKIFGDSSFKLIS